MSWKSMAARPLEACSELRAGLLLLLLAALFSAPALHARMDGVAAVAAVEDIPPEAATARSEHGLAHGPHYMVSTANPLATHTAVAILEEGGTAADAAVAAQMVLNLVEPQSSGIGGGGFIVHYSAGKGTVQVYDGRETAPAAATADRFTDHGGRAMAFSKAVNSGLSVGVPGLVRAVELLHQDEGRLPWRRLFQPAAELAAQGFAVSPRLHALIAGNPELRRQPAAARYFFDGEGRPWPVGHRLANPELAAVFQEIAEKGADAFYEGRIARDIVQGVSQHPMPGDLSLQDLAGYRALAGPALCAPYRVFVLCGMPPPSSGPLAVMQILGILSHTPIDDFDIDSVQAVHYFSEAGRLAFADRDRYVADPRFVEVPVQAMLEPGYLARRALRISADHSMGTAPPGRLPEVVRLPGRGEVLETPSTTHITVADSAGNVVSMTTSIESAFGSKIFVRGFLLNNQLTDFSLNARDDEGRLVANRVEPLKRPRSSMAPMIVLKNGLPYMALGSPGGSAIINFVAKTLRGVLDRGLDIQQAIDLPNRGSRNRSTEVEKGTALEGLIPALEAMGHHVRAVEFSSGVQGIVMTPDGWEGGADPRREGLALGG